MKNTNHNTSFISIDAIILFLRINVGLLIFINHGLEKIFRFHHMLESFPDPLGIGKLTGLIFSLITDNVCAIMIIVGLFTRINAFLLCINLLTAFLLVHKGSILNTHGELVVIYFVVTLIILLYGPGNINAHKILSVIKLKKTKQ